MKPHLPLDLQIDSLCDQFERRWRAGQRPRIEDLLPQVPPEARHSLLRELVSLEVAMRADGGESLTRDEYLARFPECQELIEQLVAGFPARLSLSAVPTESMSREGETLAAVPHPAADPSSKPTAASESRGMTPPRSVTGYLSRSRWNHAIALT